MLCCCPRHWVVKRSFGWAARFKRLSHDYTRLASTLTGMHWAAFVTLLLSSWPKNELQDLRPQRTRRLVALSIQIIK